MSKFKKKLALILLAVICVLLAATAWGCSDDEMSALDNSLQIIRTNGITMMDEVLAIYNAGVNPATYPGFNEFLAERAETDSTGALAGYVISVNAAVARGTNLNTFGYYEAFKNTLLEVVSNPGERFINEYIFAYLALKTAGMTFDETAVREHLESLQLADGGFTFWGDEGDVDATAMAISALILMYYAESTTPASLGRAITFVRESINDDGTFASWGTVNANSTAVALSALIAYYGADNALVQKAAEGLALFELEDGGFSLEKDDGEFNPLATAQAATALGDLQSGTNVWTALYRASGS